MSSLPAREFTVRGRGAGNSKQENLNIIELEIGINVVKGKTGNKSELWGREGFSEEVTFIQISSPTQDANLGQLSRGKCHRDPWRFLKPLALEAPVHNEERSVWRRGTPWCLLSASPLESVLPSPAPSLQLPEAQ